ncbi:MAG: sensor histidine kinase KdpD [Phycisphaeraceae bacterium]|nr:sensor histidine kinase KdpD [Phycisphaeraceae bacterium]
MVEPAEHARPDPDALLAQVKEEETHKTRGRLKVFFGAAAGVGKTFAMISEARRRAMEGLDVVVGYAEPHARPETEELLLGLDLLPSQVVEYRGAKLKELDLEAALKRRPELLLVDELAHTNAPGLRHVKRWQDVEELLAAGINVYTTLNVQHLESLNDVVAQITGVVVRETVPDVVFENADEVELVDLPPDELLERLQEGKVYIPQQAEQAVRGFFRKPNLTALRELALRKVADRVGSEVLGARDRQGPRKTWPTHERILVCIGPSPSSAKVIRSAKRLAVSLRAQWIAAHVETTPWRGLAERDRVQLHRHFQLAERLGAETVTLSGHQVAEELVSYARQRNVSKIMAGKPDRRRGRDWWSGSLVDQLLRRSGEIDVYVVRGLPGEEPARRQEASPGAQDSARPRAFNGRAYGWAALTTGVCSLVSLGMLALWPKFDLANLVMIYLAGVVFVAARFGRGVAVFTSILSVVVFDFVFVPPQLTLAVHDTQYLVTFIAMLSVAIVISALTARVREQAEAARLRERRTGALYRMTQALAAARGAQNLADTAMRHVQEMFQARTAMLLPDESGRLTVRSASDSRIGRAANDGGVAQWVFDHRQFAGRGTDTLPAAEAMYIPLTTGHGSVGVLAVHHAEPAYLLSPDQRLLLDAVVDQIALAFERDQLAQAAHKAQLQAETENLRSSLLSSVSHDLRTPLAVITGASSSLLEGKPAPQVQREMVQTIHEESERLTRLVGNLLDITRLEAGAVTLHKEWQPVEEVIGSALHRLERPLTGRQVRTAIPADLPMLEMDGVLMEQVLVNLLENAVKYTAPGSGISITAAQTGRQVQMEIADEGPGLAPGEEKKIFEKFYRGERCREQRGAGLGLAICRAIVEAHGGRIGAENRQPPAQGAVFRVTIPVTGAAPTIEPETAGA